MIGLDAERAALNVKIDNYPISNSGEIQALISGRATYSLTWISGRGRYEIDRRDAFDIAGNPADTVGVNTRIMVEHKCGMPAVERLRIATLSKRARQSATIPADPPF